MQRVATRSLPSCRGAHRLVLQVQGVVVSQTVMAVENLTKRFVIKGGPLSSQTLGEVRAVDGVTFTLDAGETFALVGESGCGKTTIARTILRLYAPDHGH